jgi:hypothetical protein
MNERIFELAKQADLIQWDTLSSGARTPDHASVVKARKFAELIIKECIAQCEKNKDHEWLGFGSKMSAFNIKEHFGVEE